MNLLSYHKIIRILTRQRTKMSYASIVLLDKNITDLVNVIISNGKKEVKKNKKFYIKINDLKPELLKLHGGQINVK